MLPLLVRLISPTRNRYFSMHSAMKKERKREKTVSSIYVAMFPSTLSLCTRDNNRSNQRETTREDSKSGCASRARAFPPSPRNLILSNVIPETRLGAVVQSICIRALESLDSDFQLASRERMRMQGEAGVSGT